MARAIWSGSISFGLLNVPVKLYSAVARRGISLREIRESDGVRIRHRRVAEGTDEEVPYEKIQKAFEITSGNYVPISKDEMAALAPKKSRAIEVQEQAVNLDQQGLLLERFGDRGGDVAARDPLVELTDRAVREFQVDHVSHVHFRAAPSGDLRGGGTGS